MFLSRLQAGIGWAALIAIIASAVPLGGNSHLIWLVLTLIAVALFAVQILIDFADGVGRSYREPLALIAALFVLAIAWALYQLTGEAPDTMANEAWGAVDATPRIAVDPTFGRHILARVTAYAMLFWIALRAAADDRRAIAFVRVIAVWSTVLALYGIAMVAMGFDVITGDDVNRVLSATFVNRNNYATYAGIGLVANLAMLWLAHEKATRRDSHARRPVRTMLEVILQGGWLYLFGAAIVGAALTMTQSRGGLAATVAGIVVFVIIARSRTAESRRSGAVLVGLAAALYGLSMGVGAVLARFLDLGQDDARFAVFPGLIAAIADKPAVGHGFGGFEDGFRAFLPAEAAVGEWEFAHNSFLENVIELGIPAAMAFYLALALILFRLLKGTRTRRRHIAIPAFALTAGLIGALQSLTDFSLQMPAAAALFAFVLGIGWAQSFNMKDRIEGRLE